jgi:hypothetical protein
MLASVLRPNGETPWARGEMSRLADTADTMEGAGRTGSSMWEEVPPRTGSRLWPGPW